MSVNLEWAVPMSVVSPYGTVDFNTPLALQSDGNAWLYLVNDPTTYKVAPAKFRPTTDSLSQADGSTIQPVWIDGIVATMDVSYWVCPNGDQAAAVLACDQDLREMDEFLMGCLNSLRSAPEDVTAQQYRWRPSGASVDRLLNGVMMAAWPDPDFSKGPPEVRTLVSVGSPYPFAVDDQTTTVSIADGGEEIVRNPGNADAQPVVKAYGPSSAFVLEDLSSGFLLSYDSTRPGAVSIASGHYAEIDMFAGTIQKDGSPLETDNLIAGMDPQASTWFPIPPGARTLAASGAAIDVCVAASWV